MRLPWRSRADAAESLADVTEMPALFGQSLGRKIRISGGTVLIFNPGVLAESLSMATWAASHSVKYAEGAKDPNFDRHDGGRRTSNTLSSSIWWPFILWCRTCTPIFQSCELISASILSTRRKMGESKRHRIARSEMKIAVRGQALLCLTCCFCTSRLQQAVDVVPIASRALKWRIALGSSKQKEL